MTVGKTAARVIEIARGEIGYHEGRSGGHWNNDQKYSDEVPGLAWSDFQPWCDTFVAWCFWKAGALRYLPGGATASTDQSLLNAKKAGRFSEYPGIGAQAIFGHNGDPDHTGIVADYGVDTITTVEGNTNDSGSREGDGVYLKTRLRRDPYVIGYLYPEYPEGIDSADPAYAERKPMTGPTRVSRGRDKIEEGVALLTEAVRVGRRGRAVRRMRNKVRRALADGPET